MGRTGICPNCGETYEEGEAFCAMCGIKLPAIEEAAPVDPEPAAPAIRICSNCGITLDDPELNYCPNCGTPLEAGGYAEPEPEPVEEPARPLPPGMRPLTGFDLNK